LSDFRSGGCLIGEMQKESDPQLLREYAAHGTEAAFGGSGKGSVLFV